MVRLLRLLAFGLLIATVSLAQYLYATLSLTDLIPSALLAQSEVLSRLADWSPASQLALANWLALCSMLGFGLITPWWHGERGRTYRRLPIKPRSIRIAWWGGWLFGVIGIALAVTAAGATWQGQPGLWVVGFWLGGVLTYLVAGWLATWARPAVVYGDSYLESVRPWKSWPWLVVVLIAFGALYGYRITELPARIDPDIALIGLAAESWLRSGVETAFALTTWGMPQLTLGLPTLALWIGLDGLTAVRLAGLVAALLAIAGAWAIGSEFFRRVPLDGLYGEGVEDDGRWMTLMAAVAFGVTLPLIYLSRMPLLLEPIAWGMWGLWALLRGLRRDRPMLIGLSAFFSGLSLLYGLPGLTMLMGCLIGWGAVLLLEHSWFAGKVVTHGKEGEVVRVQRGIGVRGLAYWSLGVGVTIAPLIGRWIARPETFAQHWLWSPLSWPLDATPITQGIIERLSLTLLGINHLPDQSGIALVGSPLLQPLLAPIVILALGALLLNIDSLVGAFLTLWLTTTVVIVSLTSPTIPYWPAYLVLLPALSLTIAFGLDRLRLLLLATMGTWSFQATVYLALGLLVAAGFWGWVDFYGDAQQGVDMASSMARALREAEDAQVTVLNGNATLSALLDSPAVQLAAATAATRVVIADVNELPPQSPGAHILLSPDDWQYLAGTMRTYPGGTLSAIRDLRANPLIYIYELPTVIEN